MIYDAFQKKAFQYIQQGHSVIVAAPTGAGKTVIAEHVIENCLKKGEKVIYTSPIKALSNQKYRDFKDDYDEHVGILTGDVTINADASTLIMTTEIFRNKILEEQSSLKDYSWVIFDEIHYLDDHDRGSVWEESLIFLPPHMNLLGLSATIPNIDEVVEWLQFIHKRPIKIVKKFKRPVPLHMYFQCQGEIYDDFDQVVKKGFQSPTVSQYHNRRIPRTVHLKPNNPVSLIKHLAEENRLPCIYFVFSRRRTEYLAEEMQCFDFLTAKEKERIKISFQQLCERFDLDGDSGAAKLQFFIERGIAYHHAGMLPTLKEVVERLFTSRMIKVIFTTETFALGINMPARSVILDELSKFYGYGFNLLKTRDFYQMAGRAGRRSIDKEGFVFCRINPHYTTSSELQRIIYGETEKVFSQFNASYATLINLYVKHKEKLYDIYPLSLHHFQEKKYANRTPSESLSTRNKYHKDFSPCSKRALSLLRAKVRLLKNLGHIQKNVLTEKGLFAGKVYGYELVLSELYVRGLLDQLSVRDLGLLILAVIFEPRKGMRRLPLPKFLKEIANITEAISRKINRAEKKFHIKPLTKCPCFHLSNSMEAWLKGESFDIILEMTSADEGEVVRYFRMTIQILRDIRNAKVSDELRHKLNKLLILINRDVIDSEKQLRN